MFLGLTKGMIVPVYIGCAVTSGGVMFALVSRRRAGIGSRARTHDVRQTAVVVTAGRASTRRPARPLRTIRPTTILPRTILLNDPPDEDVEVCAVLAGLALPL
jgi:hypothetical protein